MNSIFLTRRYSYWVGLIFAFSLVMLAPLAARAKSQAGLNTLAQSCIGVETSSSPEQQHLALDFILVRQQYFDLAQQGRYKEAITLAEQFRATFEAQLGPEHLNVAASLRDLARLHLDQKYYNEAEPLFQRALAIREMYFGCGNIVDYYVVVSLMDLARLYLTQSRYPEAEPLLQRALAILEAQPDPDSNSDVASILNALGFSYLNQGHYPEAESLFQRALRIFTAQSDPDSSDVATSLNNLAEVYRAQGRYREAEPLIQRALDIHEAQPDPNYIDITLALTNLAALYTEQGRYPEAEPLLQRALDIHEVQLDPNHTHVVLTLTNLAEVYRSQGRYSEAEPLIQRALNIHEAQPNPDYTAVYASLNNLATLYVNQERYADAEHLLQRSLAILIQFAPNHPDIATSLNNLAELYRVQRRYEEAELYYQDSLPILRGQLGNRHPRLATSLNNLAGLYQVQDRYEEAEALFQDSLSIRRERLGDRHPDVADSLINMAWLHQTKELYGEAIVSLGQGLNIQEWNLDLNLATLPEAQRQAYVSTISGTGQFPISLHLQSAPTSPEAAQLALTTLLRRKGRLLDAGTNSLQRLHQNLTPDDQATLDRLTATQSQLATLIFNPLPDLPPEQYRARLAELEAQANQLSTTLARRSAAFRVETQPVDIAAVQAQIPVSSILVEFTRYQPFDAQNPTNPWGSDRYAVYILSPNGTIQAVDLGDAALIDSAVQAFVNLLQDRRANLRSTGGIDVEIRPDVVEDITGTLKTLILDPIAPFIQGHQHLLISPDSQLNRLPFEALQTSAGRYLVEDHQISYLSSGRDLLRFRVIEPSRNPAVIVANPDYETAADSPSSLSRAVRATSSEGERNGPQQPTGISQFRVDPLPGTDAEWRALAPLLTNPTILNGPNATENALKQVQSPQILHIATHGFFLEDQPIAPPEQSRSLSFDTVDGLRAFPQASIPVENPLLRSGLALAGFNTRTSGTEDGVFTALEAANLNLSGTQLVVLSACDTGLGDINNGEGVYGLRRAFAIAGAETQLLSLWQVSDDGTQSLMTRYYENLIDGGMGRSEALREVQLEMIREGGEYSHPYYWAAFVLAGDWRTLE